MKHIAFCLFLMTATLSPALIAAEAAPVADTFTNPAQESRARALQRQLRCMVCQGESIDESGAPLAADLRHLVRQQMAEGKTDRQIEDYLVARYGDFILMKPPMQPDTYILWLTPFLVLTGAAAVAIWVIGRARRADKSPSDPPKISDY